MNNIDKIFTTDPEAFAGAYLSYLSKVLDSINLQDIGRFIKLILDIRDRGNSIFFIGNGGSASTASHFANDLSIGTNSYKIPIKAISLTDNIAIITAIGNDFGYDQIFLKQLQVLGNEGDLLVSISASGNSRNLITAIEYAKSIGMRTFGLTAFDGGVVKKMCDDGIHVPTEAGEYGPAEDAHMILDHLIGAFLLRLIRVG
jgi:D-sedoheptulose 7-phosphate isomerase